jgi:hypothetical protein
MGGRKKNRGFIYLFLILVIIAFGIFFCKKKDSIQLNKQICLEYMHSSFSGMIDSCFLNYQNKGTFTFKLKDNDMLYVFPAAVISHPENYLNKGDYIVKIKDESKYNIYKKNNPDSLVVLNFDCSYWNKK